MERVVGLHDEEPPALVAERSQRAPSTVVHDTDSQPFVAAHSESVQAPRDTAVEALVGEPAAEIQDALSVSHEDMEGASQTHHEEGAGQAKQDEAPGQDSGGSYLDALSRDNPNLAQKARDYDEQHPESEYQMVAISSPMIVKA